MFRLPLPFACRPNRRRRPTGRSPLARVPACAWATAAAFAVAVAVGDRLFVDPGAARGEVGADVLFLGAVTVFLLGLVRTVVYTLDSPAAGIGLDAPWSGDRLPPAAPAAIRRTAGSLDARTAAVTAANRPQAGEADSATE